MTELISREAVGEIIAKLCERQAFTMTELIRAIDKLPTVNAERKRGKWIDRQFDGMNKSILYAIECSACNDVFTEVDPTEKPIKYNFCPNCGARMDGEE